MFEAILWNKNRKMMVYKRHKNNDSYLQTSDSSRRLIDFVKI